MHARRNSAQSAQANTDYTVLLCLVGVALLAVVTFFGNDIKELFFGSSSTIRDKRRAAATGDGGGFERPADGESTIPEGTRTGSSSGTGSSASSGGA